MPSSCCKSILKRKSDSPLKNILKNNRFDSDETIDNVSSDLMVVETVGLDESIEDISYWLETYSLLDSDRIVIEIKTDKEIKVG